MSKSLSARDFDRGLIPERTAFRFFGSAERTAFCLIDENINNTLKQIHCDNKPVKNIIESEEKKKFAYNNEIKRRLVINNKCIPHNVKANSKSKVKWAGLQGSIN